MDSIGDLKASGDPYRAGGAILQPQKSIEVVESHWNVHIPWTRWMFTFGTSAKEAYLRCIDLTSGVGVGEMKLGPKDPSQKLMSG
jgi:hypothetical protein